MAECEKCEAVLKAADELARLAMNWVTIERRRVDDLTITMQRNKVGDQVRRYVELRQ